LQRASGRWANVLQRTFAEKCSLNSKLVVVDKAWVKEQKNGYRVVQKLVNAGALRAMMIQTVNQIATQTTSKGRATTTFTFGAT
jgi:hypothetical protein